MSDAFYFLVILIAFADDGNDVSAARQAQRVFDGFFAVRYDHGLFDVFSGALLDVLYDVVYLLVPRVIGSDDRKIRHFANDFTHCVAPQLRTVAAAAEYGNQPFRLVKQQHIKQAFYTQLVVRIIQQYTHVARAGNNLCPPFYLDGGKAGLYRLVGDAEIPRGSDGAERVVNRKQAGQRQEQLVSLAPLAAGEKRWKNRLQIW